MSSLSAVARFTVSAASVVVTMYVVPTMTKCRFKTSVDQQLPLETWRSCVLESERDYVTRSINLLRGQITSSRSTTRRIKTSTFKRNQTGLPPTSLTRCHGRHREKKSQGLSSVLSYTLSIIYSVYCLRIQTSKLPDLQNLV